jgi:putative ABC transport system permease protein
MKYFFLLWASLGRKRLRTTLTLTSIVIAFLLYGMLQTLTSALTGSASLAGADRLITMHKVSLIQPLPEAYVNRIRSVPGVNDVSPQSWFGGIYQDDRNQIAAMAVETENFFTMFPEYKLPQDQQAAWQADRTGAIVGKVLAERFGWKVGDTIPLRSNFYTKPDGGTVWDLKISGIYDASNGDNQSLYFHHLYLEESRSFGKGTVGMVSVKIDDPQRAPEVSRAIDALFVNSSTETKTATEKAFIQGFANQMGNIGAIVGAVATAVFFTMLLVTANTMAQSVRERTNELGVMKTLGFSSFTVTSLVMGEALLITLLGATIGLLLAAMIAQGLGEAIQQFFPSLGMPGSAYAYGALLAVVLGALAGALPCAQAFQLKIVDALRRG